MAGLFNDIVGFVARVDLLVALGQEVESSTNAEIREGAVLSAAVSLAGLADAVKLPSGRTQLELGLATTPGSLDRVSELVANDQPHQFGRGVISGLLGLSQEKLAAQIVESSTLTHDGASEVLTVTTWITMRHLADRYQQGQDIKSLVDLLQDEQEDFREGGWGDWLDGTLLVSREELQHDPLPSWSTPSAEGAAQAADTSVLSKPDGPEASRDQYAAVEHLRPAERSRRRPTTAGLVLLLVLAAGAAALVWRSPGAGDGTTTPDPAGGSAATTDDSAQQEENEPDPSSTTTVTSVEAASETGDAGGGPDAAEEIEVPDVAEYSLALSDPQAAPDVGGTLDLSLNTVSGEVCYLFDVTGIEAPYAAHLHIGPSSGRGGITVDFGMVELSDSGCVQAHPADLVAAVSSPSVRYVEAHDPSGAVSIRAQLQDAEVAAPAPETSLDLDRQAHTVIVDGNVVLRGTVTDQETMDDITQAYRDLNGTTIQVVNEMRIDANAEAPSGQVLVEDSVFFEFDSVEITDEANEVLTGIANLVRARPDWSVSVLGHTDSSGSPFYNFSLSLRRAQAVQQALIDLGAPQLAVTTEGFGPVAPRADNETADGRAENRRIDFMIRTGQ